MEIRRKKIPISFLLIFVLLLSTSAVHAQEEPTLIWKHYDKGSVYTWDVIYFTYNQTRVDDCNQPDTTCNYDFNATTGDEIRLEFTESYELIIDTLSQENVEKGMENHTISIGGNQVDFARQVTFPFLFSGDSSISDSQGGAITGGYAPWLILPSGEYDNGTEISSFEYLSRLSYEQLSATVIDNSTDIGFMGELGGETWTMIHDKGTGILKEQQFANSIYSYQIKLTTDLYPESPDPEENDEPEPNNNDTGDQEPSNNDTDGFQLTFNWLDLMVLPLIIMICLVKKYRFPKYR